MGKASDAVGGGRSTQTWRTGCAHSGRWKNLARLSCHPTTPTVLGAGRRTRTGITCRYGVAETASLLTTSSTNVT